MLLCAVLLSAFTALASRAQAQSDLLPGLDTAVLQQRSRDMPRLHSLLISHQGKRIYEQYFAGRDASQPANLKSASKSIISALVGLALQNGHIKDIDQPIVDFFPEYIGTEV
jgi:CubicO group peptidase (beta-lactamase class C family)